MEPADDARPDDDLARRLVGQPDERGARRHVEQRLRIGRVEDVLIHLPEAAADRRERFEQRDLVCPHAADGRVDAVGRRVDVDLVMLVELPHRHPLIEHCRARRRMPLACGKSKRDGHHQRATQRDDGPAAAHALPRRDG